MKVFTFALLALLTTAEAQAATCESLLAFSLPHTTVTLAQPITAGAFSPPTLGQPGALQTAVFKELPAFCRVAAVLRPVSDSEIRIEVWMPLAGWNGKFHGVGNGGHGGTINYTAAESTIDYYRKVVDTTGSSQASDWLRLFLAPGMAHCSDGEGPNTFDMISALERWVENNQAPGSIVASHSTDGKVDRTRPLCPYPQVAKYNGTGSIDEAANFRCVLP